MKDNRKPCRVCGNLTGFNAEATSGYIIPACMEHVMWIFPDGREIAAVAVFDQRMDLPDNASPVVKGVIA